MAAQCQREISRLSAAADHFLINALAAQLELIAFYFSALETAAAMPRDYINKRLITYGMVRLWGILL
jgi:hypothetical protein